MIDLIKLLFVLAWPTLLGLAAVCLITGRSKILSGPEKLALAYLAGCGILTLIILLIGAFKIKLDLASIILATALPLVLALIVAWRDQALAFGAWSKPEKFSRLECLFLALISLRVVFVLYENLIKPVISVDAYTQGSLRAKAFFIDGSLLLNRTGEYFLGGGWVFYPLNIPLLQTWTFNVLGYWNDLLPKVFFGLFFAALLTIFYALVKRTTSRPVALLGTYLLTTLPLLAHHATIEYSDLPLAVYFTAGALLLLNYFDSGDRRYLYLSAIMAGIGTWTKTEGMPLLLASLVVLGLFSWRKKASLVETVKELVRYGLIAGIFKIPWSLLNIAYHIPKSIYHRIEYENAIVNLDRLPVIAQHFYQKLFFYGNWNIAWFTLIIVCLLSWRRLSNGRSFYSLAYIVLVPGMFVGMYYLTENYTWLLDGTTLNRNTLLIMPLVIYFIAVNLSSLLAATPALFAKPAKRKK